jgi:hypothetical protein
MDNFIGKQPNKKGCKNFAAFDYAANCGLSQEITSG